MTALTAGRNTPYRDGENFVFGVATTQKIYAGSIVVLSATGYAESGATATGKIAVGRCEEYVYNDLADGLKTVKVRRGCYQFLNSAAADLITIAQIGDVCYIVDDQTVAKTDGGTTRSPAGFIMDVDDDGVWVLLGYGPVIAGIAALVAASNLSDVADAATAYANIKQVATATATGAVEIATAAEAVAGTADKIPDAAILAGYAYEKMGTPAFTIGAEGGNVINVGIQLKDSAGADLAVRGSLMAYLSDDANGDSVTATGPDGTVIIGTDGVLIPVVAKKMFQLVSEADGDIDINITESAAPTWYLILVMPDGKLVASTAITFA